MHTLLLGRSVAVPDTRLADVARTISRHGRPVVVLTEHPLSGSGGAEVRPLGRSVTSLGWAVRLIWHALSVVQLRRADVIGATDVISALVAVLLGKLSGATVVFDVSRSVSAEAGTAGHLDAESLRWRLALAFERFLFRHVDVVVAPTRALRNDLIVRGLVPASKLQVVRAGVDTELMKPLGQARARRILAIDSLVSLVAVPATGDWRAMKSMLTALAALRTNKGDVKVVVVGQPHARLREAAHARGVGDALLVAGPLERSGLSTWLSACDVAVALSSSELESDPFLLAAMACGVATLASDTAAHREVMNDPALLLPIDATELSIRLSVLLTRSQRRQFFGERARLTAQVECAWEGRTTEVLRTLGGGVPGFSPAPAVTLSPSR